MGRTGRSDSPRRPVLFIAVQLRAPGTVQGAVATWRLRMYAFKGTRSLPLPVLFRVQVARISKPLYVRSCTEQRANQGYDDEEFSEQGVSD